MTIDEAIKHYEEVAEEKEKLANTFKSFEDYGNLKSSITSGHEKCLKCAKEYRQLAEWLRELKALKENDDVKDVFKGCKTCKYLFLEPDDYPCDRCCHRYINQYIYDDKREVHADDT